MDTPKIADFDPRELDQNVTMPYPDALTETELFEQANDALAWSALIADNKRLRAAYMGEIALTVSARVQRDTWAIIAFSVGLGLGYLL